MFVRSDAATSCNGNCTILSVTSFFPHKDRNSKTFMTVALSERFSQSKSFLFYCISSTLGCLGLRTAQLQSRADEITVSWRAKLERGSSGREKGNTSWHQQATWSAWVMSGGSPTCAIKMEEVSGDKRDSVFLNLDSIVLFVCSP